MNREVLILHNDSGLSHAAFAESNAGTMEEVGAVAEAIEKLGGKYISRGISGIEQLPGILADRERQVVFNLVEELPEDITHACLVPAICQAFSRPCTGNGTPALLLAQNKWHTKAVLKNAGIPVPDGGIIPMGAECDDTALPAGKYIVKPVFSDASEGIDHESIVDVPGERLQAAAARIHRFFKQPALVEKFIPHRELNVSLLEQAGRIRILPIAEIDFSAFDDGMPRIVDYAAKWKPECFVYKNTPRIIPAPLPASIAETVRDIAIKACAAVGCRDYSRVDLRLDGDGRVFIMEVNPNPDISPGGGFAAALEAAGMSYEAFIENSLCNAVSANVNKAPLYE